MKQIFLFIFCCFICFRLAAQPMSDSLKLAFDAAKSENERGRLFIYYIDMNTDKDTLLNNLIELRKYFEEKNRPVIADYIRLATCRQMSYGAQYADALNELYQLLPRFEKRKDEYGIMACNRHFSYAYYAAGDSAKTLYFDRQTLKLSTALGYKYDMAYALNNLAADLGEYGHFDSAYYFGKKANDLSYEINNPILISKTFATLAEGYIYEKKYDSAVKYIKQSLPIAIAHSQFDYAYSLNDLGQIFLNIHQRDSSIFYATQAADVATSINLMREVVRAYETLSKAYKLSGPIDSAYKYLALAVNTRDSIYGVDKLKQVQFVNSREQARTLDSARQKTEFQYKIKIYSLLAGLVVFFFIGYILYRNSKKEKEAKVLLQKKNELIEHTLNDLKATQTQLIQSEKMASLGELTAGIAHEIQNPLNFVNNFSEVNKELAEELQTELSSGNIENATELANDIKDNSDKINHHGKRADAIVKGMLQHSRSSDGKKDPTDINALCDEYLRLAYHGIRAKDHSFNVTLKTDFDPSIGKINIIPQDIGRVVMNLLTNAFYAVKQNLTGLKNLGGLTAFEPMVSITTQKLNEKITIIVEDNGSGIPDAVKEKIFQPFFTTKPTGQGTGLGLSLSYDIIKAHGGTLEVKSEEGVGTSFVITLPA